MIVVYFPAVGMFIFNLEWWDLLIKNGFDSQIDYDSAFCVLNRNCTIIPNNTGLPRIPKALHS